MKKKCLLLLFAFSSFISFCQTAPAVPTNLSLSQGANYAPYVIVKWTNPATNVLGVKVYFSYVDPTTNAIKLDSANAGLTQIDTLKNLLYNVQYSIKLRAYGASSTPNVYLYSPYTTVQNITLVNLLKPAISLNTASGAMNPNPVSANINISDSNVSETNLEFSIKSGSGTQSLIIPANTKNYTITNLTPSTQYIVRLRANLTSANPANGPWSDSLVINTPMDYPPAANLSINSYCPNNIPLNWTVDNNAQLIQNFLVQMSTDGINFTNLSSYLDPSIHNYVDNTLNSGLVRYYRVSSNNTTGIRFSNVVMVHALAYVNPNPVTNLISVQNLKTRNTLVFTWTNGAEETTCWTNKRASILVNIQINHSGSFTKFASLDPSNTRVDINGLYPNDFVEIQVISVSDKGLNSSIAYLSDQTLGPPLTPSDLIVSPFVDVLGNSGFNLKWKDNAVDEDYYVVESSIEGGLFKQIGKINKNLSSFINDPIEEGLSYSYRIAAGNVYGLSSYVNSYPITHVYTAPPSPPFDTYTKMAGNYVLVGWTDASTNETSFVVERSIDGVNYAQIGSTKRSVASFTDSSAVNGKVNYYRVKALNQMGSSVYGKPASIGVGVASGLENSNVSVFPNPTAGTVKIKVLTDKLNKDYQVEIFNQANRLISSQVQTADADYNITINGSSLEHGLNLIVITNETGSVSKRVFKE